MERKGSSTLLVTAKRFDRIKNGAGLPQNRAGLISELKAIVGERHVLSDPIDLSVYECDAETFDVAVPDLVVLPGSSKEVAAVVKLANRHQIPFTPRGAGTGLSGGATTVRGGISLVLSRMTKILSIDADEQIAVVEVGATNASVSQAAAKYGLHYAPDPSSQAASTIGGNIAENAGGPHTLKYGLTVDHVLGVKVILPSGESTTFGGDTIAAPGIDWLGLFVGSEGTLGFATEATLRLTMAPPAVKTMIAYFDTVEAGGEAVSKVVAAGVVPAAMEMIDRLTLNAVEDALHLGLSREAGALLIIELDGSELSISFEKDVVERLVRDGGATAIKWAKDAEERAKIWKARKASFGSLGRIAPHGYVLDGVIPRSRLAQAIRQIDEIGKQYSVQIANVYHAGDGNLHPCLLYHQDNVQEVKRVMEAGRKILDLCVQLGGTLSGEHGIGIEKMEAMSAVFTEEEMAAMAMVKSTFDPDYHCNPGKLLPMPKSCGESGLRPLLRHTLSTGC